MQISPWALNYTDYIIITSSAIQGFSKPTSVLKGSARERLLYCRRSELVCIVHMEEPAGSWSTQPSKKPSFTGAYR